VPSNNAYAGWIGFAGLLMIVMGAIDFFEGLIAIIRGGYFYGLTSSNQIIVFDSKTWGWLTLLWGILVLLGGLGLTGGAGWARWFAIIVVSISILHQLAFVGSAAYPLWSLAVLALSIVILFALTVHWGDRERINP
jgi:hypothetical protein